MTPTDVTPPEDREPGFKDSRLTKAINYVWTGLGALAITGILWVGNSINEMNIKLAVLITQNAAMTQVLEDHNTRIRELEKRQK